MANLLKPNQDWYRDFFLSNNSLDNYKNDNGQYNFTPMLAAKVLLPLVLNYYRYEPRSRIWYRFNGTHFTESQQLFLDLVDSLNDLKIRCEPAKQYFLGLGRIHGDRFIPSIIEILEKSYTTHIDLELFDAEPGLLNTPDGILDLLTGESYPNTPSYLCRQITSIAPEDDQDGALCPNYIKHISFMCNGDRALQEYLELISGYILTGHTFLQEFYWFYGTANNGKSSLANIWKYILHTYAWAAPSDQFALNYYQAHSEQLIRMAGKRLVLIEELRGNKWDEAKIKSVMSGSALAAAEKFGRTINFTPICKLLFISNHKPAVDANDGGMVRRLRLMPFTKSITPDMRIKDFDKNRLRTEAPYILHRMVKHANIVMQKQTLETPTYIDLETQQYFKSNNIIEQFLEDATQTGPGCQDSNKLLYSGYTYWCTEQQYEPMSAQIFGRKLEQLGFKSFSANGIRGRLGVQLNEHYRSKVKFL